MKIYSWNMLYRNRELNRAFDFIAKSDFDIFCLQEVPEAFLARLKTLPCHIAFCIDEETLVAGAVTPVYLVVLSKYPIVAEHMIPFPDYWPRYPIRSRLFVHLMRPLHFARAYNRHSFFVDVMRDEQLVRIFNLHLPLAATPATRVEEFETALENRDTARPTIVCGDFNLIESPRVSLLNWIFGGSLADTFLYHRARTAMEKLFIKYELLNPLRGKDTHLFAASQLDHILVPRSFLIKNAVVLPDRVGSDHHPIRVEIA
jgi:endonuclease/exonuclease/phosphatase family metal-dependent hydrolase